MVPPADADRELHLYLDDSGSREPDHVPAAPRRDGMDYFALGGILINAEDTDELVARHAAVCARHEITYPLHSNAIRGGYDNFRWLKRSPEQGNEFWGDLEDMLLALPVVGHAAVIHRPGYVARYGELHAGRLWLMCKTAYCVLIERAAIYARSQGRPLRVFYSRRRPHRGRRPAGRGRG